MLRRLFRQPVPKMLLGLLAAVIVFGGGTSLVSQDFRDYVKMSVARALPGEVIGGCEIKPYANCPNALLSRADLSYDDLRGANLSGANLMVANLSGANLSGANLTRANLTWADLSYVELNGDGFNPIGANLSGALLVGADLSYVDLTYANLTGATLDLTTNLANARFCKTTMPDRTLRTDPGQRC